MEFADLARILYIVWSAINLGQKIAVSALVGLFLTMESALPVIFNLTSKPAWIAQYYLMADLPNASNAPKATNY
jgi:hypothetical protein